MTAIVGVINSQAIAIAADSAVTVSGGNVKKVYNKSNKIFTLSKYHPVGIAIYNSADFAGIPLETIIKMYRKSLGETSFATLAEYKLHFLEFLRSNIHKASLKRKDDNFYNFCAETYMQLASTLKARLDGLQPQIQGLTLAEQVEVVKASVDAGISSEQEQIDGYNKSTYLNITFEDYKAFNTDRLDEIIRYVESEIRKSYATFTFHPDQIEPIKSLLFSLINIEFIYEAHCGLIFFGFGEDEIYPSSQLALLGAIINDLPRVRLLDVMDIQPGTWDARILPYAQGDVTEAVLTGVDPNYKAEVVKSIEISFDTVAEQIRNLLNNAAQSDPLTEAIKTISDGLIQKLDKYQFEKITGPLLEVLAHMGKEDMSELAESLVNITSLKRKFTSNAADESVGGPVDVAIVTKGDGFIWMKRKQYFDGKINPAFFDKYFK